MATTIAKRLNKITEAQDRRDAARRQLTALIGERDKVGITQVERGLKVAYVGQRGKLNLTPLVGEAFGLMSVEGRLVVMEMELIELLATNCPRLNEITIF